MTRLPVIQGLWIGEKLSSMEQLSIKSFIQNGHDYHLYAYEHIKGVPKGTLIKDANSILSSDHIFKLKDRDTFAGFSNLFRYKLLLEKGGFWCDTDVVCLKPFKFDTEYVFGLERYKSEHPKINNAIICTPPGTELMQFCYSKSKEFDFKKLEWGIIGPELFGEAVEKFKLTKYSFSPETFYPIEWWKWSDVISDKPIARLKIKYRIKKSNAIHLWHEMWRLYGIDKNRLFPKLCLYENLKQRYLRNQSFIK